MKTVYFYKVLIALVMIFPISSTVSSAGLEGTTSGQVLSISTHLETWGSTNYNQDVITSITISGLPKAESGINGCVSSNGFGRVAISKENPAYEEIFATALAAKTTGQTVIVHYLDTCSVRSNSWDLGIITLE